MMCDKGMDEVKEETQERVRQVEYKVSPLQNCGEALWRSRARAGFASAQKRLTNWPLTDLPIHLYYLIC